MEVLWNVLLYQNEIQFFFKASILYITKIINLNTIYYKWKKQRTQKWQYIPDHPYKILSIGGFGSRKTNALLNLIKEQDDDDIDKFSCM